MRILTTAKGKHFSNFRSDHFWDVPPNYRSLSEARKRLMFRQLFELEFSQKIDELQELLARMDSQRGCRVSSFVKKREIKEAVWIDEEEFKKYGNKFNKGCRVNSSVEGRKCVDAKGCYVLYDQKGNPTYVGRAVSGLIKRLDRQLHGNPKNESTVASMIALTKEHDRWMKRRSEWADKKLYRKDAKARKRRHDAWYRKAKTTIAGWRVKYVPIPDSFTQVLFLAYAAFVLNTRYQTFGSFEERIE